MVAGSWRILESTAHKLRAPAAPLIGSAFSSVKGMSVVGAAVATAVLSGSNANITGVATGSATITVKAIDLDNPMTSQSFEVSVP